MIRFDILTLFPEMFESPLSFSILKRAREKGILEVCVHNIRDYAEDKHRITDDAPYGGGGGMVMKVEPIDRALKSIVGERNNDLIVLLTPQGEPFDQESAADLSSYSRIILVCGHYEGVDERVRTHLVDREISIGDYILTGGELSAMVIVDAVTRLIPGVLGNDESAFMDSFSDGLLEYPHYTRPSDYRGLKVPEVLVSGNHKEIREWRRRESLRRTSLKRPDLLKRADLSDKDREMLASIAEE